MGPLKNEPKKPRARTDVTLTPTLPTCSGAGPSLDTVTAASVQKFSDMVTRGLGGSQEG